MRYFAKPSLSKSLTAKMWKLVKNEIRKELRLQYSILLQYSTSIMDKKGKCFD